jgi:transcriptional regulator with XRE-family HTH domain
MTASPAYMSEPWFGLLLQRVDAEGVTQASIAKQLGISSGALSQVLHGKGAYGNGTASTTRIADRVIHTYGRYPCPHLSAEAGEERVITAEQCRAHAHRPPPADCQHLAASAPPVPRAVQHRHKVIPIQPQEASHAV